MDYPSEVSRLNRACCLCTGLLSLLWFMGPAAHTSLHADDDADAAPITVVRPFLWKVESPLRTSAAESSDGDAAEVPAVSWLFGTIHVPDPEITTLHPTAQKAFDDSQAAYFEIDFLKNSDAQVQAISLPEDQKLEDILPPELLQQLDNRLKSFSPAMQRSVLPNAHVGVWPLLLGNLQAQVRKLGELPLDMKLYVAASRAKKEVGGLESPDSQLQGVISLPLEEQIAFLKATLDGMDDDDAAGIDRVHEILQHYAAGDEQKFVTLFEEEFQRIKLSQDLTSRILDALLHARNQDMANSIDRIITRSPEKSVFFAVGLGHLTGKDSVQEFLTQKGYRVTRFESETLTK
jgi:uncharacterized protein YbaP (TraB family)